MRKARLGRNMRHALAFAQMHTGLNSWATFKRDRATLNAIKRLEALRLVETNSFGQFRATSK